jgi:Rps23 Pro-64 3,4-dihydroxylase Tpa1-like proline 4-hydroxylase
MIRWPGDVDRLAREFRTAKPFPHVVIDRVLSPEDHARLVADFDQEPQVLVENEIYLHLRSSEPPMQPSLRAFTAALGAEYPVISTICGSPVTQADGAAYVYLPGHYLLPHSDSRPSEGRAIAYAYYVSAPKRGGELELFESRTRRGEIVRTRAARRIAPRPNRLVLFAVSDLALHRVREVLDGARTSIAGWFYP